MKEEEEEEEEEDVKVVAVEAEVVSEAGPSPHRVDMVGHIYHRDEHRLRRRLRSHRRTVRSAGHLRQQQDHTSAALRLAAARRAPEAPGSAPASLHQLVCTS